MVNNVEYVSIHRILDDLLDHPMLSDVSIEQVVRYTIRFIGLFGFPALYEDKIDLVEIDKFRGVLPCGLIRIIQVRDAKTKEALRSMTDTFTPVLLPQPEEKDCCCPNDEHTFILEEGMDRYPCKHHPHLSEQSFKTQGRVIYTSFPKGEVEIAYKAIKTDEDGYPMIVDNEVYIAALEAYIKKQIFTIKFDQGKIATAILQNAQQEYSWLAGQLHSEFTIPSMSEMESITRMLNTMVLPMRHFDNEFKNLGDREYLRRH